MGIGEKRITLQTRVRDGGWRIKTIPWWQEGELQKMYTTPLTTLMGFGGAALFLAAIWAVMTRKVPLWFLGVGIGGLLLGIGSNYLAAYLKTRRWIAIRARVVDCEIRKLREESADGPGRTFWTFRLICEFNHRALKYRVTPAIPFYDRSEEDLKEKLAVLIDAQDECRLWVNPANHSETVLERKPKTLKC